MQHGHMNVKFRELRHEVHHLQSRKPATALTGVVSVDSSHTRVTVKLHWRLFLCHCSFLLIGSVAQRCRAGP